MSQNSMKSGFNREVPGGRHRHWVGLPDSFGLYGIFSFELNKVKYSYKIKF